MKPIQPLLSVICPTLDEEAHIEGILRHFVVSAPLAKEMFIIDGGSQDRTREIVEAWSARHPGIHLLDNPERYVPHALNRAIPLCRGRYIARIDAHTEYAPDYYQSIVDVLEKTGADIAGGPTRTKAHTPWQAAIAKAICTPMAIGNSRVHFEDYEGYTDSVTFGAWRREVFEVTGLFDTDLVRNQDDEFHYRAKSKGLKIYQSPDIKLYYYPRSSLRGLFRQYHQYGRYKPLVLRKVPKEWKWRHLIPSLFVLYLFTLPLALWVPLWALPMVIYGLLCLYVGLAAKAPWAVRVRMPVVFPVLHVAYGGGFLKGVVNDVAAK